MTLEYQHDARGRFTYGKKPPREELRRLYEDQRLTGAQIAKRYSAYDASVYRWLESYGIPRRQERQHHPLTDDGRARLIARRATHVGFQMRHESLIKRARTIQLKARLSDHEAAVLAHLQSMSLWPVPLFAVDKYNIDIAFPKQRLGFEVTSGGWHNTPRKKLSDERRMAAMAREGWTIVDLNTQRTPPEVAARDIAEYLLRIDRRADLEIR